MAMAVTERTARRSSWGLWLRVGLSVVILTILVSQIRFGNALPEGSATILFLVVGVLAAIGSIVLAAWRWQCVFRAFEQQIRLRTLVGHYFAGQFVGNALPSTIGGDVVRISRAAKTTGSVTTSFASVVLERLTGWIALPLLTFLGLAAQPSLASVRPSGRLAILIAVIVLVFLGVILYASGHPRLAGRFASHENWMRFIGAVHIAVDRLRRHPRSATTILGASLVYQASAMLVLYIVVRMLELPVSLAAVYAFGPAVAILQVLPISFNGLGVREGALVLFLHPLGVSTGEAVTLGLIWYGMLVIASLLGAPSFAVGHRAKMPTPGA